MKLIKDDSQETISISNFNYENDYIMVGKINREPVIFHSEDYEEIETLKALALNDHSLHGNSYDNFLGNMNNVLKRAEEVQIFNSSDWKKALKWLIDNC
jgi:hypothetical protein